MADAGSAVAACIKSFCNAINLVVANQEFKGEYFKQRNLFLAEAYCLLWHNAGTGDIDGRKSSIQLRTGALAAIIIDLYALDKIDVVLGMDSTLLLNVKFETLVVKVKDFRPTHTYLDEVIFDKMISHDQKHPQQPKSLYRWLERACHTNNCCVSLTIDNLIKKGILEAAHSGFFGMFKKYPTLDAKEEQWLDDEMKKVALGGEKPDSYMLALLTVSRTADDFFFLFDPILKKHFSKDEYKHAKENIKTIVLSQGKILVSPKYNLKSI